MKKFLSGVAFIIKLTPGFLVSVYVIQLCYLVFSPFKNINLNSTAVYFLTIIALLLSLSSVVFNYSRSSNKKERGEIHHAGECFLYSSISFIYSFIFIWVAFKINNQKMFSNNNIIMLLDILRYLTSFLSSFFALGSAFTLTTGLTKLEYLIYPKVKHYL